MYYLNADVISNNRVIDDIYEITISCAQIAAIANPGQFLHVKTSDTNETILRRPISISRVDKISGLIKLLYQVKGTGTILLSKQKPQNNISIIGPIGNGFPIKEGKRCAIVGGGIGIAPLLELSASIKSCDAYLGFRNEVYKVSEFNKLCRKVYITTEDGTKGHKGYITDLLAENLNKYDIIYTCGPKIMMQKVKELCRKLSIECYVSLEERMGCGVGACLVCVCKTSRQHNSNVNLSNDWSYSKVCVDGPVFRAEEVLFDD